MASSSSSSSAQSPPSSLPAPQHMSLIRESSQSCIEPYPWISIKLRIELDANINAKLSFTCSGTDSMPTLKKTFEAEFDTFLRSLDYVHYSNSNRYHFITLGDYKASPRRVAADTEERYGNRVEFRGFPDEFMACFDAPISAQQKEANELALLMAMDDALPDSLMRALKPYQREGIAFAIEKDGKCLIADEMGLGKSLQFIAIWRFYAESELRTTRTLIVCPSSLRVQWSREFIKWLPDDLDEARDILVLLKGSDFAKLTPEHRIVIVSYDLASRLKSQLTAMTFGMIGFDESHMIKNFTAQRTQALLPIAQRTRRTIMLSGTPAFARPMELYTQIRALRPEMFRDRHEFGTRYCGAFILPNRKTKFGKDVWVYNGCRNDAELHLILKRNIMIRRLKKNVLTQLPEKTREQVFVQVPMTKAVEKKMLQGRRLILELQEREKAREQQSSSSSSSAAPNSGETKAQAIVRLAPALASEERNKSLFELYGEMAQLKAVAVREYLKDFFEINPDEKVLIFAHHRVLLDGIADALSKDCKVGYMRIDGSTAPQKRADLVTKFQENPKCKAAVLGITAAGVGLTLTAASIVIFAELHWTPAMLLQCEDRAHRIGQRNNVLVKYLVGRDTMEEDMWKMIAKKFDTVSRLLDNDVKADGLGATVVPNGTSSAMPEPASKRRKNA